VDKTAMFKIGYGLYVLTAHENGKDNGCIVNTVMQITDNPLTVIASINKHNYTCEMVTKTGQFNVSMLTVETPFKIFEQFGFQSGRNTNKFDESEITNKSENGIVYLPKFINAYISCKVINTFDFGTHMLFHAEVFDAKAISNADSLTYVYYQKNIKPKPESVDAAAWRCNVCGYIYKGDHLPEDYICPLCKHGVSDFVKVVPEKNT